LNITAPQTNSKEWGEITLSRFGGNTVNTDFCFILYGTHTHLYSLHVEDPCPECLEDVLPGEFTPHAMMGLGLSCT